MRNDTGEFLRSSFAPIEIGEDGFTWWTYAGGKINNTLKIVFKNEGCNMVLSSNEWIRIEKKGFSLEDFTSILSKMKGSGYFSEARFLDALIVHVPNYRHSKFQSCLPEAYQKFLIAQEVLDVEDTVEFLKWVSG